MQSAVVIFRSTGPEENDPPEYYLPKTRNWLQASWQKIQNAAEEILRVPDLQRISQYLAGFFAKTL